MYFYKSVKDNDYKIWYTIYKCNINIIKQEVITNDSTEYDVFVISHRYDTRFMLLAMTENQSRIGQYLAKLREKTIQAPKDMMEFNETIRYPIGIMYLHIDKITGFDVPDNTYVSIQMEPYILESRHVVKHNNFGDIHQRFYIPIHNHFSDLVLDIEFCEIEGWFREKLKKMEI